MSTNQKIRRCYTLYDDPHRRVKVQYRIFDFDHLILQHIKRSSFNKHDAEERWDTPLFACSAGQSRRARTPTRSAARIEGDARCRRGERSGAGTSPNPCFPRLSPPSRFSSRFLCFFCRFFFIRAFVVHLSAFLNRLTPCAVVALLSHAPSPLLLPPSRTIPRLFRRPPPSRPPRAPPTGRPPDRTHNRKGPSHLGVARDSHRPCSCRRLPSPVEGGRVRWRVGRT